MLTLDQGSLCGSIPPLVTPFRNGNIDHSAYAALAERAVDAGSTGLVVCGTTGEPTSLSVVERCELLATAAAAVGGRVPVVAATGTANLDETTWLSAEAQRLGASALLVVTPYYAKPPQRALVEWFARVADVTDLPILIYHIPGRAAVGLDPVTVAAIVEAVPQVVGVKHAVADLGWITETLSLTPDGFRILVGVEELSFPMLAVGASGLVNALGNVVPEHLAAMCAAVERGDFAAGRQIHDELFELNRAVFWDTNPIAVKHMMSRLGLLDSGEHRLPLVGPTPELEARLDELLSRHEQLIHARTGVPT